MPGSLSIFGQDALTHTQLATEVCAEKLVRKYQAYSGRETTTAWDWITTGPEHFCDALTGAFALASWFRAYDALSQTIDAAALGVKPIEGHQDDLFDPMKNSALLAAYDGAADTTEGTGDAGTLPHPSEQDLEAALEDGRERPDYPTPKFKTVNSLAQNSISRRAAERQRALRKLAKFRKGKWRK